MNIEKYKALLEEDIRNDAARLQVLQDIPTIVGEENATFVLAFTDVNVVQQRGYLQLRFTDITPEQMTKLWECIKLPRAKVTHLSGYDPARSPHITLQDGKPVVLCDELRYLEGVQYTYRTSSSVPITANTINVHSMDSYMIGGTMTVTRAFVYRDTVLEVDARFTKKPFPPPIN